MVEDFLPEARYQPTLLKNWQKDPRLHIGKIVHVLPEEYLSALNTLYVYGENFPGIIETSELSIYPIDCFEGTKTPKFLPNLFGHCITAKIINFSQGKYILSRKITMQEALEQISIGQIVEARKISVHPKIAFVDIGGGLNAIIPTHEVTSSLISDIRPVFSKMKYFSVKILTESTNYKNKFIVSYKQAIDLKPISKGDIVIGKATNLLEDGSGIFVELSPIQTGIADIENLVVISPNEVADNINYDIILGNYYNFTVHKVRDTDAPRSIQHYSLRLLQN